MERIAKRQPKRQSKRRSAVVVPAVADPYHDVLVALRRIIRAVDLQSRQVSKVSGLTTPQVLVLQTIRDLGEVTTSRISNEISLSQATVTTIMDRLEQRGLIERYRSERDRRIVHTKLTRTGRNALRKAPPLLNEQFIAALSELEPARQAAIVRTLQEVAGLLGGGMIDAAPILDVKSLSAPDT